MADDRFRVDIPQAPQGGEAAFCRAAVVPILMHLTPGAVEPSTLDMNTAWAMARKLWQCKPEDL